VYSIERIGPLHEQAQARLKMLGIHNVKLIHGDGFRGWPDAAPFDAIIVTAAPEAVPQPLLDQLSDDGRLVIPVGSQKGAQELRLLQKTEDGLCELSVEQVRFVPLLGGTIR
jgi:protein-L-isoaspartate(D-aspartate) O-methyltransferase